MHPLSEVHLGCLARALATSQKEWVGLVALQLIHQVSPVDVSISTVDSIISNLLVHYPALLGGPIVTRPTSSVVHVISSSLSICPQCGLALDSSPKRDALAFVFGRGWVPASFIPRICVSCNSSYCGSWSFASRRSAHGVVVVDPQSDEFFQIVAVPKRTSKAFIDQQTLLFVRTHDVCILFRHVSSPIQ